MRMFAWISQCKSTNCQRVLKPSEKQQMEKSLIKTYEVPIVRAYDVVGLTSFMWRRTFYLTITIQF